MLVGHWVRERKNEREQDSRRPGALLHCGHGSLPKIWLPHPAVITKSLGPDKAGPRGLDRPGAGWRLPLVSSRRRTRPSSRGNWIAQLHRSSGAARGCAVPCLGQWAAGQQWVLTNLERIWKKAHHGPPISQRLPCAIAHAHPCQTSDQGRPSNPEWHLIPDMK